MPKSLDPPRWICLHDLSLAQVEEAAIRYAFHQFKGNHTRMRKSLGVSKKTMLRKLAALGLRKPLASRVRHLTEHDIARSFQKHRAAIATELKIHDSTLMKWIASRLPALLEGTP